MYVCVCVYVSERGTAKTISISVSASAADPQPLPQRNIMKMNDKKRILRERGGREPKLNVL